MATNQAVWQAWNEQRNDICEGNGTHIMDEDYKHACSHEDNTGSKRVLILGHTYYRRCNIFFCPHAVKINKRAKAIQEEGS